MIYNTFYSVGNAGEGEKLNEMGHVPAKNLHVMIGERKEWVQPLLECLAQLGGCLPEDPDDPDEEVMVSWDNFLYMFLRFNSLTREELSQFMFMSIVKILRQEDENFSTFHYLTDVQLDTFYERYRKCTIPAFSPRDVWFRDLELRRYYASDFVEVTQRFAVLLNPAQHLQREMRRDIPSTGFWDKFDHETSYNRKLTIEFFMMKKTHVFLRGEPPLRETCDLLLPTALGYDPSIHYHKAPPPKATLAAREHEANRMKAVEAKKLRMESKKHNPLMLQKELFQTPGAGPQRTELGRSAKEQAVKTINGRIQPPVLNKRPDVHPDTVGKALSVSLTSAKVAQKYEAHVKMLHTQLQLNQEQAMGGNPAKAALYAAKKKDDDGLQPGSVPGTVGSASRSQSPKGPQKAPKKIRQPPPVASVDLPRWMRDIPLKYLD